MASQLQVHLTRPHSSKQVFDISRPQVMNKKAKEPVPLPSNAGNQIEVKAEPLVKRFGISVIHVLVGQEQKDFCIHKSLICHHSPFFRKAFNSGFEEGRTGIMKLKETEAEVFELFFVWLYMPDTWRKETRDPEPSRKILLDLYLFADMIGATAFKNAVLRRLHPRLMSASREEQKLFARKLNYIWENTTGSSPIRWLIVDLCIWKYDCAAIFEGENAHLISSEVYSEIIVQMFHTFRSPSPDNPLLNISNYQELIEAELQSPA